MTFFCENWANLPIDKGFKDWMLNDSVPVYEDFLYERPFVNLALLDSATLDSLQRNPAAKLNRNCYYLGYRGDARCAVGLFKSASDPNTSQKTQPVSSLRPLRFKSELDWSKMGVKVDFFGNLIYLFCDSCRIGCGRV